MKLKAKIEISGAHAELIAYPLVHDNMDSMRTVVKNTRAATYFEADKIGSLIASVDDYLMNLKVAREIVELVVGEREETE